MEIVCLVLVQRHVIASSLDVMNLLRNVGISAATAYALCMNLTNGRMDLSLGAQRMVGTVIGGNLALSLGLSGIWILIFAVVCGLISGWITGMMFVTLRLPPMVLGIGMALIWECIAFAGSKSAGLQLFGIPGVGILSDVKFSIVVTIIVAAICAVILEYTKFSYDKRSIRGSSKIAQNSGIDVFKNAVICYTLAGALVAISGVLDAGLSGSYAAAIGFSSNAVVMKHIFAMRLGNYMSKWSNQAVGILSAAFVLQIFTAGIVNLRLDTAVNSALNLLLFLFFLIYLANEDSIRVARAKKKRIAEAKQKKQQMQLT
jgi:ribose/xylose/arabinose/galactoside ABC-type transport system permease subunit